MTTLWLALGFVLCIVVALTLYWKVSKARLPVNSASSQADEPSLPTTQYTKDEVEIIREQDSSFQVRSTDGTVLLLTEPVATQVHRYLSPLRGCACSCAKHDSVFAKSLRVVEKDGKLFYEQKTNVPGAQVFTVNGGAALRGDRNLTLVLDRSAAHKLHVLLRPEVCQCKCLVDGVPATVQTF